MPVGAIIGAGALTAGASVYGASKNSKAINKATAAQTQSNNDSVALQRDIYGQNRAVLSPFVQRGNVAGETMNALLGLGGNDNPPAQPVNALASYWQGYNPDSSGSRFGMAETADQFGSGMGSFTPWTAGHEALSRPLQGIPSPAPNGAAAAGNAFDTFRNSTGYKFRLDEGMNALNSGYAGAGTLQSGAAMKAALKYGQDYASGEFGNYLGYLGNQQGVGMSAASATAGVGQGYANNITSLNQANANALGQSAVARANNMNGMITGIGTAFGNTVGAIGQMNKLPTTTGGYGGGWSPSGRN